MMMTPPLTPSAEGGTGVGLSPDDAAVNSADGNELAYKGRGLEAANGVDEMYMLSYT
jgi:hypothetical protein